MTERKIKMENPSIDDVEDARDTVKNSTEITNLLDETPLGSTEDSIRHLITVIEKINHRLDHVEYMIRRIKRLK